LIYFAAEAAGALLFILDKYIFEKLPRKSDSPIPRQRAAAAPRKAEKAVVDGASRMSYIVSCDGARGCHRVCVAALRGGAHLDLAVVLLPVVQALGVLALGELPADVRPVVEQLDHALGGEAELELSEKCRALIGRTYLTAGNSLLQSGSISDR
jgi:hypothetical protein